MRTLQQSIEVRVPVSTIYNQLTQFEEYPNFMEDVEMVQQIDDTHLRWITRVGNQPVEWDAEITEQEPDRCIMWQNTRHPSDSGRLDVRPLGPDSAQVTFTLQSNPVVRQEVGQLDAHEMSQRLKQNLARLKDWVEVRGAETGAWRGEVHDAEVTLRDRDARAQEQEAGQTNGQQGDAARLAGRAEAANPANIPVNAHLPPSRPQAGAGASSSGRAGGQ